MERMVWAWRGWCGCGMNCEESGVVERVVWV